MNGPAMLTPREIAAIRSATAEARRHYRVHECLGVSPELERAQPGHSAGCALFYAALAASLAALIYGIARGF
jgi:hypothetical protein